MSNVSDVSNADTVWIEKDALIDRIPRSVAMALLFIVVVAIWDLVTRMGWVSPIILPSPAESLADLIFVGQNLISGQYMLEALWTTTLTVFYAFLIATAIGFSLGVLVGETKFGVQRLADHLSKDGIPSEAIHGNKSQSQRQRALNAFKGGKVKVLIATDVAARGLDIPNVSHVINFDTPSTYEDYVHRIGRTGRGGAHGAAFTFIDKR